MDKVVEELRIKFVGMCYDFFVSACVFIRCAIVDSVAAVVVMLSSEPLCTNSCGEFFKHDGFLRLFSKALINKAHKHDDSRILLSCDYYYFKM